MKLHLFYLLTITLVSVGCVEAQTNIPDDFKLVYTEDFEAPQVLMNWEMTDPEAWRIETKDGGKSLELFGKSQYESRVRSPFNIAVIKDLLVGDFIMEIELSQTGREYGHRDLCLFFGIQNATNFYYVHIASVADQNANNIFLVNDEPRTNIATKTTKGTNWGETNSWHKARIERDVTSGSIKVYFDDMSTPIMEATDQHFDIGRIGVGSFDDTGQFDNVRIWAPGTYKPKDGIFR